MSERLSRRDFLVYGGATVAGVTLGEWGRRALARADAREASWRSSGQERWATSVCRECPAACGVRVRLVDDMPVKLEGNPLCPMARGRLCAKGQAALEGYFDPDRLVGPARRVGKRGEHRWEPITWATAIELVASRLSNPAAPSAAQPLALAAEERGPLSNVWRRFWTAAGARVVWTAAPTAARLRPRVVALTGIDHDPLFDLEHATHVLSLGAPLAEDWLSPVWTQRSYGLFRRGPSRPRGRLVQLDAHRSITARKADEWLAVSPDEQVLLAYGIASVILRENRADRASLDLAGGNVAEFEREVVETYPPDEVAAATGVPVVTLLRIAREVAGSARPLVVVAADARPALVDAALALNALVGALDRPGGVFASPVLPVEEPEDASAALREMVTGELRPRVVAFRDASALRALSSPVDLDAAFATTDLVVSFSPYLDEAADLADLLIPTQTPLEAWHGLMPPAVLKAEALALARPVLPPRLDTRDSIAILGAVATMLGGEAARACPWASSETVVAAEVDRLLAARRGGPYSGVYETEWLRELERGGWWVPTTASREEFTRVVLDSGGWSDPFFEAGAIRASLRARGGLSFTLPRVKPTPPALARSAMTGLAVSQPPDRDAPVSERRFPLRLLPFVPPTVSLMGGSNHPALFELLGQPESEPWRVWAELSPETARELGIEKGAEIRVTSASGASMTARALLVERMARDAVAVAFVPSNPRGGRWARLVAADVRRLWGNDGCTGGCTVRVTRA